MRWLNTLFHQSHPGLLFGLKDYVSFLLCTNAHHSDSPSCGFGSCVYFSVTTRESSFIYCHTWTWKLAHPCKYLSLTTWIINKTSTITFLVFCPSLDFHNCHLRIVLPWNKWFASFGGSYSTSVLHCKRQISLTTWSFLCFIPLVFLFIWRPVSLVTNGQLWRVFNYFPLMLWTFRIHLKLACVCWFGNKSSIKRTELIGVPGGLVDWTFGSWFQLRS